MTRAVLAPSMQCASSVAELRTLLNAAREAGRRIGFVPTMGALHAGHAALMRAAGAGGDLVVVSCYVNPRQFGVGEDLERYPRTPDVDRRVADEGGVDVLWLPADRDVYGSAELPDAVTDAGPLGDRLEGAARPGHFDGVVAVVARLLTAVEPDVLYLGEKDYQQLVVVRQLVARLGLPVSVLGIPTAREPDGLALSSRNAFLTPAEREAACAMPRALAAAEALVADGHTSADAIEAEARAVLDAEPLATVDYVQLVDVDGLERTASLDGPGVVLLAAHVGATRLIDNRLLTPPQLRIEDTP